MQTVNLLIVEDEMLIALSIKKMMLKHYSCVEVAKNYNEALQILKTKAIDIVLLDINLNDTKTGIDIANYIQVNHHLPFIYLTALTDSKTLQDILKTKPSAYLSKPVQEANVITAINLALQQKKEDTFTINIGKTEYIIDLAQFLYAQSDNVYITLYFTNSKPLLLRTTFSILELELPKAFLKRINRSEAINPKFITKKEAKLVFLNEKIFKISEKYYKL